MFALIKNSIRISAVCDTCWDLDRREFALKRSGCDGNLKPFMSMEELRTRLFEKWQRTQQTSHIVIKDAIINPPTDSYSWVHNLEHNKKLKIEVKFV